MSLRDGYEHGVPCWIDIAQADPEAAARFYGELFGWEVSEPGPMPGDPPGRYYVARKNGRDVAGLSSEPPEGSASPPAWGTYMWVTRADDAAARVRAAGGSVLVEPFDVAPAGRMAVVADPAGATFCLWEPGIRQGAQVVNEAGAWAMSFLNTPDPDAAKAFYGEALGWRMETFAMGGRELALCRVPGYVGGEPHQPVSREVVAGIIPAADAPAHWGVEFWVHDADETADRAVELGGAVVAGPYDTPISRQAVLVDPQGATFSVSKVPAAA